MPRLDMDMQEALIVDCVDITRGNSETNMVKKMVVNRLHVIEVERWRGEYCVCAKSAMRVCRGRAA